MQLEDWLDDLCVRFIVNIPSEELGSIERICFQIEEAQWFYEDFIRPLDPSLPSLSLKPFFLRITQRCPLFRDWPQEQMGAAFEQFLKYKNRVPVRGAIMLTDKMDEVLLVKGWKKNGTWSFPRGKINKDESDIDCAVREAWEETGFDLRLAGLVDDKRKPYPIDQTIRSQSIRLFVFRGVPRDAHFMPQTRKEISKIEWYKLSDLPTLKKKQSHQEGTINANKYYMVAPFMTQLKKYIAIERKKDKRHSSNLAAPPMLMEPVTLHQQDYGVIPLQHAMGPLSPPIPSSLPEVDHTAIHDPAILLKQQLNLPPVIESERVDPARSNALLALLRSGPVVEIRNDPHTPADQTEFASQPRLPDYQSQPPYPVESYQTPPVFDMHQQAHPTAPPPSALPQLSQHKLSLLQAFQQKNAAIQAAQTRDNLSANKQNLLAAFRAPAISPPAASSTQSPANDLLALLKHKSTPDTTVPRDTVPHVLPGTRAPPPTGQAVPTPAVEAQMSHPTINPLLQILRPPTGSQKLPQLQEPELHTDTDVSTSAPQPDRSPPPLDHKQAEPVELSAVSEQLPNDRRADASKENLLSLLKEMPRKASKQSNVRNRTGSVAATLSGPVNQPHFDAIPKVSVSQDEIRRDPITTPRKLFDPKTHDSKRPPNIQVLPRQDERTRSQKSPRTARQKSETTPRQPATPKEPPKPFQPQILKRPQTAEGEGPQSPFTLLSRNPMAREEAPEKLDSSTKTSPEPVLPILDASPPGPVQSPTSLLSPTQKVVQIHDPQREALLSLLRAPSQRAEGVGTNDASQTSVSAPPPPVHRGTGVSPPTPSQLVSPVVDGENSQGGSRSRVSSLASTGNGFVGASGGRPHVEKRQTTASDKAFLMSYLKSFATQDGS